MTNNERNKRYRQRHPDRVREATKKWRSNNYERHLEICRNYQDKKRKIIREAKNVPCTDCGKRYPYYVMDFDHIRGEKVNDIACLITSSVEVIKKEIAKCEVVCANCHRERTQRQKNKLKNDDI